MDTKLSVVEKYVCKYCLSEFNVKRSVFLCHVRYCNKNPNKDIIKQKCSKRIRETGAKKRLDRLQIFKRKCYNCDNEFEWKTTKKNIDFDKPVFCCLRCAKQYAAKLRSITHYVTICFKYHDKKCCICGFDKVVEVHHNDNNHKNNDKYNLIPICPNHHIMVRMLKYKDELQIIIDNYIEQMKKEWGSG